MHKKTVGLLSIVSLLFSASVVVYGQSEAPAKTVAALPTNGSAAVPISITATTSPLDLARAALAAQGGDKFKNLKSVVLIGTVNFYAPNQTQPIPGKFVMVTVDNKIRVDSDASPMLVFKQIFDGQRLYSSTPAVPLPPPAKFGPSVLAKFDQNGYTVTALPDDKKLRGFRIAGSEGNGTNFHVDPATGRVVKYVFDFGGYTFENENQKMKEVEGVLVAHAFTVRIETPQGAFLAEYSVKDVKLNQPVGDDVFVIPN
jgi:hypothetical protein